MRALKVGLLFAPSAATHRVKVRFLLVGLWNTIFGYLTFVGLDTLFVAIFTRRYVAYMAAMVLSNVVAIANAFVLHKYVTFRSSIKGIGVLLEFLKFFATYLVTFFASLFLLPLFVEAFHIIPRLAGALVILICTIISYLGHSRFSFRSPKPFTLPTGP